MLLSLRRALGMPNLVKFFFFEKLKDNLGIICRGGNGFHPLRNIVNRHKDVKVVIGRRKRTHKVDPPYIKQLYFEYATLRHFMPLGNVPFLLTYITSYDKFPSVFKERRPIEACLEYFRNRFIWSKVATIG